MNRAPGIIRAARDLADVVIVEAPPLLAYHDTEALSQAVDVVLVVGDCDETKLERAKRAGELLRRINAPILGVVLTSVEIGTRDIRHLVSVRPESTGVEEPLEGVLEPAPHAGVAGRDSETLERAGNGNSNGKEGEAAPDRELGALDHVTNRHGNGNASGNGHGNGNASGNGHGNGNANGNGNGNGKETVTVPGTEPATLEHVTNGNGHGNGNGNEKVAVGSSEPATLEHVTNGNGHGNGNGKEKVAVGSSEPATLEHVTNGNGHGNGNGKEKVAVGSSEPATLEHVTNGNGHGNGNGKEKVAVGSSETATLEHVTNGNGHGNGNEKVAVGSSETATLEHGEGRERPRERERQRKGGCRQ